MMNLGVFIACGGIAFSLTVIVLCLASLFDRSGRWFR